MRLTLEIDSSTVSFSHLFPGSKTRTMQDKASYDVPISLDDADETDDYSRAMWAFDAVYAGKPREIIFPAREIVFDQQVTLYRGLESNGSEVPPGDFGLRISGHGCSIRTTEAISAFRIKGNYTPATTLIEGLRIADNNPDATAGFEATHSSNVMWLCCVNNSNSDAVDAAYAPFYFHQSNVADPDTGCFWHSFPGSVVRSNGTALMGCGVLLEGACNAFDFTGFSFAGLVDGLVAKNPQGDGATNSFANGVDVRAWFEAITGKAVRLIGEAGQQFPDGWIIIPPRIESIATLVSMEGFTLSAYRPPHIVLRHSIGNVNSLLNNPNGLHYNLDISDETRTSDLCKKKVGAGLEIESTSAANDVLSLLAANTGSGLRFSTPDGLIAYLRYVTSGVFEIAPNFAGGVKMALSGVQGLSGTATRAKNLRGQITLAGNTGAVTFAAAEADTNYFIALSGNAGETFSWANKTTGGFTINSTNTNSTAVVDWHLIR